MYEDDFAEDTDSYMGRSGQYDEQGNQLVQNTDSNGRFHTDWLNMIYPRLRVAKDLLTEDGVIFISIDDGEIENLKKMCDEVFGDKNFLAQISIVTGANQSGEGVLIQKNVEYCSSTKWRIIGNTMRTAMRCSANSGVFLRKNTFRS